MRQQGHLSSSPLPEGSGADGLYAGEVEGVFQANLSPPPIPLLSPSGGEEGAQGEKRGYRPDDPAPPLKPVTQNRLRGALRMLGQIFYGMTVYDMVYELNKERGNLERLFVLAVFGDVLGVPILPPYYALRLLPYVVPVIGGWRHSLLRERDLTDLFDREIG